MKILYVCKSLPHRYQGGIQSHVWKLSEWMAKLGHDVSIVSAGSFVTPKTWRDGGRTIIEIPYLPGRKLPYGGLWAEEWSFNVAVRRWLERHTPQYDIVHAQGRSGFLFAGKQGKTPLVTTFHGLLNVENHYSVHAQKPWITQQHERWATNNELRSMRRSDKLIAVSDSLLQDMLQLDPSVSDKTIIIPNGIDDFDKDNPHADVPQNPNLLLFVGRIEVIKGIFPLLEAMLLVRSNIELHMIGDGTARTALEQKIQEKKLHHRVKLLGPKSSNEVYQFMKKAYAVIVPSFYETQGIVSMEANICARPVLASATSGILDVVKHDENGLLMPVNNPQAIAESIDFLFSNPELAQRLGATGKRMMLEKFSWEAIAKRTEAVYKNLLPADHSESASARTIFYADTPSV